MEWQTTWRDAVLLIFGRAFNRTLVIVSALVLILIWGPVLYGRYASILGTWSLCALAVLGIEKSALKFIPRYKRIGSYLTGYYIGLLLIVSLALLLLIGLCQMIILGNGLRTLGQLEFQVAILSLLLGNSLCLSAIGRARGKPLFDVISSVALGVAVLLPLLLTWMFHWSPLEFTYVYNLILVLGNLIAVRLLLPYSRFSLKKRRVLRLACRWSLDTFIMSLNLMLATAAVSVIYISFRSFGSFEQASRFNIAALVFGIVYAFFHYCFGIILPSLSVSIKDRGAKWVYLRLIQKKKALTSILAAALVLALGGALLLDKTHDELVSYLGLVWFWLLFTPFFLSAEFLTIVFELLERPGLVSSIWANALGLLVVAMSAFVAIPYLGARGGVISLLLGDLFICMFLLARLSAIASGDSRGV